MLRPVTTMSPDLLRLGAGAEISTIVRPGLRRAPLPTAVRRRSGASATGGASWAKRPSARQRRGEEQQARQGGWASCIVKFPPVQSQETGAAASRRPQAVGSDQEVGTAVQLPLPLKFA